ncbi:hypothetical protein ACFST9_07855 [Hymenobacter monticola]|uniref:Lipoprotein n=1 Tax=Hymenobacter monticola TaxID=1705399 RepID=A0ABY4B3Q5_9BACT|nr:hypothetical protein [Hymenobacter monticola]UOE33772.1 hypothetical protein MTP16_21955 [Hymenobacter monticola]
MKSTCCACLSLALLGACGKDAPDAGLPPATQTGANTGGCLVDGERFIATGTSGTLLSNPIPALSGGFYNDSVYWLSMRCSTPRGIAHVTLYAHAQTAGTYPFNRRVASVGGAMPRFGYGSVSFSNPYEYYVTDARHTGRLVLTYANKNAGISAGTFEFAAVNVRDSTNSIKVTYGRFDSKQ